MAITTLGFEGTIDDIGYSKRSRLEGADLATVDGRTDFSVTNGSADRTVNVAAGTACAHAILALSDAVGSLQLAAVDLTGASRWDAIVLRYAWSPNTVTLMVVPGAAALNAQPTLPSGLRSDVGDTYDQVLALAKVQQGLTSVQEIQDRRYQGHKTYTALSKATLPPPSLQLFGAEFLTADGARWRCGLDGSNALSWIGTAVTTSPRTTLNLNPATGFQAISSAQYVKIDGFPFVELTIQATKGPGTLDASGSSSTVPGNLSDTDVLVTTSYLPSGIRPAVDTFDDFEIGTTKSGRFRIRPNGSIQLTDMLPGSSVEPGDVLVMRAIYTVGV